MGVSRLTRKHNILLMFSIEKSNDTLKELIEGGFNGMPDDEIKFIIKDGLEGTFKDDDGSPMKLSPITIQSMMYHSATSVSDIKTL